MSNLTNIVSASVLSFVLFSCHKENGASNNVTLHFNNTFKNEQIVLGDANAAQATVNTSTSGQTHSFSELKYVISNIRLVKTDGTEVPYNSSDLDDGAAVIDQSKPVTLGYMLTNIPYGDYKQLKFGLGIKKELNTLDQVRFPVFYSTAGANDTKMMWEWGAGYRFTKIEGFYGAEKKQLSIHTGSTIDEDINDPTIFVQGVDAYRDILLDLDNTVIVGKSSPVITIKADFDKLLSGKTNTITLTSGTGPNDNATPNVHSAVQMTKYVNNLGGNGDTDKSGIFSISNVKN